MDTRDIDFIKTILNTWSWEDRLEETAEEIASAYDSDYEIIPLVELQAKITDYLNNLPEEVRRMAFMRLTVGGEGFGRVELNRPPTKDEIAAKEADDERQRSIRAQNEAEREREAYERLKKKFG